MAEEGSQITKDEEDEVIDVNWGVYIEYFRQRHTWAVILFICTPLIGFACWCWMRLQGLSAEWMQHISDEGSFKHYFWTYMLIAFLNLVTLTISFFVMRYHCLQVSDVYFTKISTRIIRAPINLYFDKTPSGWILNRFSKDISKVDMEFSGNIWNTIDCGLSLCFTMYVACQTSIWILTAVPIVFVILWLYARYYIRSYRDLV